jgi:hypothetical protein
VILAWLAMSVLAEVGRQCTGLSKTSFNGKPNPRAQFRAPDDTAHWYSSDGCGKWDLKIYGPEVVARRRAYREAAQVP